MKKSLPSILVFSVLLSFSYSANAASTPAAPTSFSDLFQNRAGISAAALKKVSESIKNNPSKLGELKILVGPNTKPLFSKTADALALVSKAFPNSEEVTQLTVIQFQYKDLAWADQQLKNAISTDEYNNLNQNEGGRLLTSNCDDKSKDCVGSKQVTTFKGTAFILQGVPNKVNTNDKTGNDRMKTGMLEAHEYFHSMQRLPMAGKPLDRKDWPRDWIREGSAEWVQNAVVNNSNLTKYKSFLKVDCASAGAKLTLAQITQFFAAQSDSEINNKFDGWLNYCMGAYAIESLVSLKGQQSLIDIYAQMSTQVGFETAFLNVYGTEWKVALPILAKTVQANMRG